jgi:carboxylesterase type B
MGTDVVGESAKTCLNLNIWGQRLSRKKSCASWSSSMGEPLFLAATTTISTHPGIMSALSRVITDYGFVCGNLNIRSIHKQPMWLYRLDQASANDLQEGTELCSPGNVSRNVCHEADITCMFNSIENADRKNQTESEAEQKTAALMSGAWGNFAHHYSTTGPGDEWAQWMGTA